MYSQLCDASIERINEILAAADSAARAIPPAFPLDATVAVNPFLGQTSEDLAQTAALLARVAGVRATPPRAGFAAMMETGRIADEDLADAMASCPSPRKPENLARLKTHLATEDPEPRSLPTMAELAATATGIDWPAVFARTFGLWASGHFDRGQALWTPAPGKGAFAAWREWATHDLTPELAGLTGFCAHVVGVPDTPDRAILRAAERLGIAGPAATTAFHRLLSDLGGWAQHARWLSWQAELDGRQDATIRDLLAIRLVWEEALLAHAPSVATDWARTVAAHAQPVRPTDSQIVDAILQEAAERAHQRRLSEALTGIVPASSRRSLQAAFCIDVRSEVFRRALEGLDGGIVTLGFAGFFGLPISHRPFASDVAQAHLPVLLRPTTFTCTSANPALDAEARIGARAARAWGRFRQAAVSSFAFVEAAGPLYGAKLVGDALGMGVGKAAPAPAPRLQDALTPAQKVATAASILRAMGLVENHARLVLLLGHGANVVNNPHESGYHCGACGGQTGEVSARLLASLLNDPETRAGLTDEGISVPSDTLFVAGLHDTTTDEITLFADVPAPDHAADLAHARDWLVQAGRLARAERAQRLPGAKATSVAARAKNWAEVRPEWGLAGCAAFIAAPRGATAGRDLGGRSFLHSYDWRSDRDFATLELILTAPVVVASWISLQYYGSTVAPTLFGSGNKLIHNVVGGIGVIEGNGGTLRAGLPWQAIHDGERPVHEPLRLSVLIEAPLEAIADVLARHEAVRALFDNGWLHLMALRDGRIAARWRPGKGWVGQLSDREAA